MAKRVGIIGCGNISGIYFTILNKMNDIEVIAAADLIAERAQQKKEEHGIPYVMSTDELIHHPDIDIVVNLTIPNAHYEVNTAVLNAGKSVYCEKPLALNRTDATASVELAINKSLRIGSAPDTFLGSAHQTARKLIDDGAIGKPLSGTVFMVCRGHERWHPDPDFYYQPGGGPVFDMGPYYFTALVNMLGPAKCVGASATKAFTERTITSKPKYGTKISVNVPTHVTGFIEFQNGAVVTLIMSFDVWAGNLPHIEIHGENGSLSIPSPNGFGGEVKLFSMESNAWTTAEQKHQYPDNTRGLGVADLANAIENDRPHRANGELAAHVVDIMQALHESAEASRFIELTTTCAKPAPMKENLEFGQIE